MEEESTTITTIHEVILRERYQEITFSVLYENPNGGLVERFNQGVQGKKEKYKNIEALKILADNGRQYRLLPLIQDGEKNPDAFNLQAKKYVDIKVGESNNGKNIIQGALKEANKQGVSEVIIHFTQVLASNRETFDTLKATFKQKRADKIEMITFIMPDNRVLQVNTARFKITRRQTE